MFSSPASAMTSASESFATVMPAAPASTCALAIAGILCVLTCGLSATPFLPAIPAIFSMFLSTPAPSIDTYGVSTSSPPRVPLIRPPTGAWPL